MQSDKITIIKMRPSLLSEQYPVQDTAWLVKLLDNQSYFTLNIVFLFPSLSGTVKQGSVKHKQVKHTPQDPKSYVQALLDVHRKYNDLVNKSFDKNSLFVQALDKACTGFINKNCVSEAANNTGKSPELLAKYCNLLLKKR